MAKRPTAKRPTAKFRSKVDKDRFAVRRYIRASERHERDINRLTRQLWRSTAKADAALRDLYERLGQRFALEDVERAAAAASVATQEA